MDRRAIERARVEGTRIDALPEADRPVTIDDGYRVQDRLIELLGQPVYGW